MKARILFRIFPVLAVAPLLAGTATAAETLEVGSAFPKFEAKDQHGKKYAFQPGTRFVLVAFDMATGKQTNRQLEKKGAKFLDEAKAVFISNIHGMPGIGRLFALPKMRRYPHRIILADEENLLDPFPSKPDHVTLFRLDPKGTITAIEFWDPETKEVEALLK